MKTLSKKIEKSIKAMRDEIWEHRKNELKDYGFKRCDILDRPIDINGIDDNYANLAWEAGYIYALQQVQDELNEGKSNL